MLISLPQPPTELGGLLMFPILPAILGYSHKSSIGHLSSERVLWWHSWGEIIATVIIVTVEMGSGARFSSHTGPPQREEGGLVPNGSPLLSPLPIPLLSPFVPTSMQLSASLTSFLPPRCWNWSEASRGREAL